MSFDSIFFISCFLPLLMALYFLMPNVKSRNAVLLIAGIVFYSFGSFTGLIDALFCEVNPIPVKAATAAMGYGENYLRLPLTPMDEAKKENMFRLMKDCGINI